MTSDPALAWLLEDAKSQGLTVSEYEERYGVILEREGPLTRTPGRRFRRHEIAAGLMADGDIVMAEKRARRLEAARPTSSDSGP